MQKLLDNDTSKWQSILETTGFKNMSMRRSQPPKACCGQHQAHAVIEAREQIVWLDGFRREYELRLL